MKYLLLVSFVTLAACAKQPDQIAAADIGPNPYSRFSCSKLAVEQVELNQKLENLSAEQKRAASNDTVGVIFLGLPVSSMSGNDKEAAIAIVKGRLQALETQRVKKKCK